MSFVEKPFVFECSGEQLVGIVAQPEQPLPHEVPGVLVIVGGPQYRVGSHRQFLLLSRSLASKGYPVFRFDYRGMGDSSGTMRDFETVNEDVGAAIDTFVAACPSVKKVVLWGLCDAASAALLYMQVSQDSRVSGLVLLNPWVRSESSLAQTHIKHYYGNRLVQKDFWLKLFAGKLQVVNSIRGLVASVLLAREQSGVAGNQSNLFQEQMASGWRAFSGKVLLILSGQDYVAMEFLEYAASNLAWSGLINAKNVTRIDIVGADHTFSGAEFRAAVEESSLKWLVNISD